MDLKEFIIGNFYSTILFRYFPADQSMQIALGNINLHTMETLLPEIDPDLLLTRENVSAQSISPVNRHYIHFDLYNPN